MTSSGCSIHPYVHTKRHTTHTQTNKIGLLSDGPTVLLKTFRLSFIVKLVRVVYGPLVGKGFVGSYPSSSEVILCLNQGTDTVGGSCVEVRKEITCL